MADSKTARDANLDPITKAPGAHPVGTGVGATVGGMAAGAAAGTVAGPIGTAVGAAVGAVVGGLAGKSIAETIDPTAEAAYWRENYRTRPYVQEGGSFDDYGPAYAYGVDAFSRYPGREFDDFEADMHRDWGTWSQTSSLEWSNAKPAARDAWERVRESTDQPPATR